VVLYEVTTKLAKLLKIHVS